MLNGRPCRAAKPAARDVAIYPRRTASASITTEATCCQTPDSCADGTSARCCAESRSDTTTDASCADLGVTSTTGSPSCPNGPPRRYRGKASGTDCARTESSTQTSTGSHPIPCPGWTAFFRPSWPGSVTGWRPQRKCNASRCSPFSQAAGVAHTASASTQCGFRAKWITGWGWIPLRPEKPPRSVPVDRKALQGEPESRRASSSTARGTQRHQTRWRRVRHVRLLWLSRDS